MKKLLIVVGVLAVLVLVAFFVVTSSGFLKSVVLPRASAALNAKVDAESIALSPFSSLEIRKLSVVPNGAESLATVDTLRVRYSLFAILGGNLAVDEVYVGQPVVTLVQKADGTSNLDPILKSTNSGAPAPAAGGNSAPPRVDVKSVRIEGAQLAYRSAAADGSTLSAEVGGLNLGLSNLRNGGAGKVEIAAALKLDQRGGAAGAAASSAQGTVKGGFDLGLTDALAPSAVTGNLTAQLASGTGTFKDLQGLATVLAVDLTPTELRRLALDFERERVALGSVVARGPLDLAKKEGSLQVDVAALDRNVLNLAGAAFGLDFTTTRFDSTNRIQMTSGGQKVEVAGMVTGTKVAVRKGELTMPSLELRKSYDLAVDLAAQSAVIRSFALSGNQGGRDVLRGNLAKPMQISWAPAAAGSVPDASLQLELNGLRLADWSALAGVPVQGTLTTRADLGVQNAGRDLAFQVQSVLAGLAGTFGSNVVKQLGLNSEITGKVAAFADPANRRLTATLKVADLTGDASVVSFQQYGVEAKADLGLPADAVVIHDVQAQLKSGSQPGGAIAVRGRWDLKRGAGELTVSARDVNEAALRPFLQAALGDKQLRSVRVVAEAALKVDPAAESTIKVTSDLSNLVVRDPSGAVPESPLAVGLSLDAGGTQSKLTLRQGQLRLTPTARASNRIDLAGELDFAKTNALKGGFKLTSDSVDVTPYFDLFAGAPKPASAVTAPAPAATPGPQKEPDPIHLPVDVLTFDARIGKFFLREVAASNWVAGLRITGSAVELQPLDLTLNGAPIKAGAKLNLGVPGYIYDLKASADRVPVRPFANSFAPALKDRIEGAMITSVEVKGAGVTGASLQKSLVGAISFNVTNANLKLLDGAQQKGVLSVLTRLLATSLNIRELHDQPIMDIVAKARMGEGKIELTEANARSASLLAGTSGTIPIATDLMQSPLNFPVNIGIRRDLAERARLVGTNVATNVVYVPLPALASLKGTLGTPVPEVDKARAALLAAQGIAGILGGRAGSVVGGVADLVGGVAKGGTNAAGTLIQGLGNLLGGGSKSGSSTNAASSTNAPASNANPLGNLLKGVLEPKKTPQ